MPACTRVAKTQEVLQCLKLKEVLLHPPYSHDLAPCCVNLFPKTKEHLKGHHFHSDNKVKAAIQSCCCGILLRWVCRTSHAFVQVCGKGWGLCPKVNSALHRGKCTYQVQKEF
ncbi:hypothetical protein JRQ81_019887 [Phrynocephalus forsythii]|uniref:Uncharacterized protein n=1 Tax=Phrynocephalus forsythii TaxID=171643 RepID=A0A9Q1AYY6_9SAUR|nr:hypothetical protein JRQ81_019887 [Phrynocephalus forsythii]